VGGLLKRPDTVGLGVMVGLAVGMVALGAGWVTGVSAAALAAVMLLAVVALVWIAVGGGLEVRRALAPYGLLKPGVLWLSLFFLAPLWTMAVMSLSSKKSRFDFFPSFTWEWSNYADALTDFAPQFGRSFLYAAVDPHRVPARVRHRLQGRQVPQHPSRARCSSRSSRRISSGRSRGATSSPTRGPSCRSSTTSA